MRALPVCLATLYPRTSSVGRPTPITFKARISFFLFSFLCLRVDIWIFREYSRLAETYSIVFDKLPRCHFVVIPRYIDHFGNRF
jgi:hypothetical protein